MGDSPWLFVDGSAFVLTCLPFEEPGMHKRDQAAVDTWTVCTLETHPGIPTCIPGNLQTPTHHGTPTSYWYDRH